MNKSNLIKLIGGVLAIIASLLGGKSYLDQREQIAELQSLLNAPDDAPAAIVASDGKVEVVYRDRVVVKEVPSEGGVRFDAEAYRRTVATLDSLIKLREGAIGAGNADTPVMNGAEAPGLSIVPPAARNASIDSLRAILADPFGSKLITIKTWGLCARPQAGIGFNGSVDGYLGCKFFFFRRFGLTAGLTGHQAGIGATYRLDRWVKPLRNTEGMILYGVPFKKDTGGLFAGIAVNL